MNLIESEIVGEIGHPIDLAEVFADEKGWTSSRDGEEQLLIEYDGMWRRYQIAITFLEEKEILTYRAGFEMKLEKSKPGEVLKVVNYANQMCLMGSFTVHHDEEAFIFGCSQSMADEGCITGQQVQRLFNICISHCEQFYPAFQMVAFGDRDADSAIAAAIIQTKGQC